MRVMGLPSRSFASTLSGFANANRIPALWPSPDGTVDAKVSVAATAAAFVIANVAGVPTPLTDAVTLYVPVVPLAVNAGAVADPVLSVATITDVTFPVNFPLGPLPGAANVTFTPDLPL